MKKFSFAVAILFLLCLLAIPCGAEKRSVNVEPFQNVSGETTLPAVKVLQEQMIAAIQGSSDWWVKPDAEKAGAQFALTGTITEIKVYEPKSDRAKVSRLIKRSFGNELNEDGTPISEAERAAAAKELKEISDNPTSVLIAADVQLADLSGGVASFSTSFTGDKPGKTEETALYNACKELAANILKDMEKIAGSAVPDSSVANAQDTPSSAAPASNPDANASSSAVSAAAVRGIIGDMDGSTIYIDQGIQSGLRVGDTLMICRAGGDVTINGKVVGKKEREIGQAKIIEVLDEYAVGSILSKTEDVQVGDIVKRVQ